MPGFLPHDRLAWPLDELIAEHKLPAVFHSGQAGMRASARPTYFPPPLVQCANSQGKDCLLFGSDFRRIAPDRWLKDFAEAGFKPEVPALMLKRDAMRLLGLAGLAPAAA